MGRWTKEEIFEAHDKYLVVVREAVRTNNWGVWSEIFTEDADYIEHHFGHFSGRAAIMKFMQGCWGAYPAMYMTNFPPVWRIVDEDRGWIVGEFSNRMKDLGNGILYEARNISIFHYAGHGLFSHQEDIYNPAAMGKMINAWVAAKEQLEKEGALNEEAELARSAAAFTAQRGM
jgi:hypothetical protein